MAEQALEEFRENLKEGTKISWIDTDDYKYRVQVDKSTKNLTGIVHPGTVRKIVPSPSGLEYLKSVYITDDRTGMLLEVGINHILQPRNGGRKSKKRRSKSRMTRRK